MNNAMGNVSWSTYALVIAAVILAIVLIAFPEILSSIIGFLQTLVNTAGTKINRALSV